MRGFPGDWKLPLLRLPSWNGSPSLALLSPFLVFNILSYRPLKTMGCFSGRLISAASDQKLFCKLCSPFCCSFNEFLAQKVITPSYSSTILTPPSSLFNFKIRYYSPIAPQLSFSYIFMIFFNLGKKFVFLFSFFFCFSSIFFFFLFCLFFCLFFSPISF